MSEALLIVAVILILVSVHLVVLTLKKPVLYYVRITAGIALLILVWGFGDEARMIPKLILTGLALTGILRSLFFLKQMPIQK